MKKYISDIQLVVTVALKKELPKDWFVSYGVPVHTLSALKSGALKQDTGFQRGILVVITGAGLKKSEDAARWILDNLDPLFVLNIGSCGLRDKRHSLGKWIAPRMVADEEGNSFSLDTRLPVPPSGKTLSVKSLLSVKKAVTGSGSDSGKKCDAVDMECYSQAKIFSGSVISFHCLKFSTDYSDQNTSSDFEKYLLTFKKELKKIFSFINQIPALRGESTREAYKHSINISVVIPVFNREQTIKYAIESILFQSYAPEAIIIVDDCSTDGTQGILESYGDQITYIRLSDNSGPSRARNEGIKRAGTDWIAFMDSDDSWKKDKLKKQAEYLAKYPFYQIIQSDEIWIRNGKRVNPHRHHKKPAGWIWEPSLERCLVSPSGVLIKKSLLDQYGGFDESLPVCEDYDLWLKISRYHPVGLEPGLSVIKTGGHEDQLSRRYPAMDRFRVQSLLNLLKSETLPEFRMKLIDILTKKLSILIKGFEKRGRIKDAREFRQIRESLKNYQ